MVLVNVVMQLLFASDRRGGLYEISEMKALVLTQSPEAIGDLCRMGDE